MPSATQLISRALRIAGVLGSRETADSDQASDGLESLNDMLASWGTKRSYIYTIKLETFNLVAGTSSYTIGSGGTFNTTRPDEIDHIVVNQGEITYPVKMINAEDYQALSSKDVNGAVPEYAYYDKAFPLGKLYLYDAPYAGLTITIGSWQQLQQFADLTTQYTFPNGYNRAIVYNLAKELAPEYGASLTPEAQDIARKSLANIRNLNLPSPVMKTEIGYLVGSRNANNILSGE